MATLQEMTAWTLEEIQAEIYALLPADWKFEFLDGEGQWHTTFLGADGECLWRMSYMEPRILLFDAYGWLELQVHPRKATNPAWTPNDRWRLVPVGKVGLPGVSVPDPEDLDPTEIATVYSSRPKR
jgi:hypothetical protein